MGLILTLFVRRIVTCNIFVIFMKTDMNVVDSSAWIEYFANTVNSKYFASVIEDTVNLMVSSIVVYEVFKKVCHDFDENLALKIVAHMRQGTVVDLDLEISLLAAKLSCDCKLPMADSIILATARKHQAILWTQDSDFENLDGVRYFAKKDGLKISA